MRKISDEQAAYIAGFLEGEGSFGIDNPEDRWRARVTVGQKSPQVLNYVREVTGLGYVRKTIPHVRNAWGTERSPTYYWVLNHRKEVRPFIRRMLPYLINKRTRLRAKCVLHMVGLRIKYGRGHPKKIKEAKKLYRIFETTMVSQKNGGKSRSRSIMAD